MSDNETQLSNYIEYLLMHRHKMLSDELEPLTNKVKTLSRGDRLKIMENALGNLAIIKGSPIYCAAIDELLTAFYGNVPHEIGREHYKKKDAYEEEHHHYHYIPLPTFKFLGILEAINDIFLMRGKGKFIDVGCGIGDKCLLAKYFNHFSDVFGIEYNKTTYNIASQFLAGTGINLLNANAIQHDFSPYSIIYMYMPIADHDEIIPLYERIISTMKNDSIMIEALPEALIPLLVKKYGFDDDMLDYGSLFLKKNDRGDLSVITFSNSVSEISPKKGVQHRVRNLWR